jgi:hypothetical protein
MTHSIRLPLLLAALTLLGALAFATVSPQGAGAIVPPRDCKTIKVKGKTYNIKADQLQCTSARRYADRYLETRWKPSGYKCSRFTGSRLVFRCVNTKASPDKTYFAIKK